MFGELSILLLTESLNLWALCVLRKEGPGKCSAKEGREEVGMEAIWRLSSFRRRSPGLLAISRTRYVEVTGECYSSYSPRW